MEVGVEFSHYRVVEHIGRGGMADVWSARDKRLGRTVAIKTISRNLNVDTDPVKLFEQEAKTIAGLEHPHILPIYEFGDLKGQLYIVMRYVSGGSLEDEVSKGAIDLDDLLGYSRAIAMALDHAHNNNVVHLDLKPSNILLDSAQIPYLADFGLATMMDPEGRAANPGSGTLLYMAPEQLTEELIDYRADIYSFTVMLFEMLTGQLPFEGSMPMALKQLQLNEEIPDVTIYNPEVPMSVNDLLRQGTSQDPELRPIHLTDLIDELEGILNPTKARIAAVAEGDDSAEVKKGKITLKLAGRETLDLEGVDTLPSDSPDAMARREAIDLYNRAHKQWANGKGRFLLGITHFMLVNDYYMKSEQHGLALDDAGMQMLLRGAVEYDHEIGFWWDKLANDARRWVALHALRSEAAPARVRALRLLTEVVDSDPPKIPNLVAHALRNENSPDAQISAINVLERRAQSLKGAQFEFTFNPDDMRRSNLLATAAYRLSTQLQFITPSVWKDVVFSSEIDMLLADIALTDPTPKVAERAARAVGRIHSLVAVRRIAQAQVKNEPGALEALAFVRDEAPSLPPEVTRQARLYAWVANSWRRITDKPLQLVYRFLLAFFGGTFGVGLYIYLVFRSEAIFTPQRWGNAVAIGITTGIMIAILVLIADELPSRLRGFWARWAHMLMSIILGGVWGTLVWGAYTYMFLQYPPDNWALMRFAGGGLALGFVLNAAIAMRGLVAFVLTAVGTYIPLWVAYNQNTPVIYFNEPREVYTLAIPLALLVAFGGHAKAIIAHVRQLLGRGSQEPQAETNA